MRSSFVFGFILLIFIAVVIFVGFPYAIKAIKSGSFSLNPFPKILTKPAQNYFLNQPKISTPTPAPAETAGKVSISTANFFGAKSVSLRASYFSSGSIDITGWRIKSAQKGETIIGKGYALPQVDAAPSDILLSSGDSADIITGTSPLSINFRVNNCFGWLSSLYNLDYSLNYCPGGFKISDLAGLDSSCQDLILRAGSCKMPSENDLNKSSYQCRQWAEKNMTYGACVANHRNDSGFYKGWKIYTGNNNPFFDSLHDRIELRDKNGILIDSSEY